MLQRYPGQRDGAAKAPELGCVGGEGRGGERVCLSSAVIAALSLL